MNTYKLLSDKGKDFMRNETYCSIIMNSLKQMFVYDGLEFNADAFETLLLTQGKATLYKWNDVYCASTLVGCNMKLPNNKYETYNGNWINGEISFTNVPWTEIAECRNTSDGLAALNVMRFADMLSEVDLSMVFNVQRSRLAPIAIAEDDSQRIQLENCMNASAKGNYKAIAASILNMGTTNSGKVNIVNLNDVTAIQYIQYLSEFHDQLTRRIYTMYGMAVQETSKHAQVNTDESNARDGVSWLIPDNMLKCRRKFCDEFNKINGTNLSVDYSPLFKAERELMNERNESNETNRNTDADNSEHSAAESNTAE